MATRLIVRTCFGAAFLAVMAAVPAYATQYVRTDMVTSATDADLINPWGITETGGGPFWISDNGTGLSTLYNTAGVKQGLVVTLPGGAPTGAVFNGTSSFNADTFIFATENGTVVGWRGSLGTNGETLATNPGNGAVYKGLALNTAKDVLFVTDFHNGQIVKMGVSPPAGTFVDPSLPAGYAPFNIANIGGTLYVTYAKQDGAAHDDDPGPGNGFVDTYDLSGNFLNRLVSNGHLNSPWGLALAPAGFGQFAGNLLVGNFGDGKINAYNPTSGAYLGTLMDNTNNPIVIDGLWGLLFGNGGSGGLTNSLYFTAGPDGESAGIFGRIDVPEPASLGVLAVGALGLLTRRRHCR